MNTSFELGQQIQALLMAKGIETPMVAGWNYEGISTTIQDAQYHIMEAMGLNMADDSLRDTPERVAKMYTQEVFTGLDYRNFPKCTTVENKMGYDEVIAVRAQVNSICEHHFVPFVGTAHIAYIPKNRVLGLSKFNRVTDFFSRRPQIQERLTEQISAALAYILDTDDVAVIIRAEHFCVRLRGCKDVMGMTTTSKLGGRFRANDALRSEFFGLAQLGG